MSDVNRRFDELCSQYTKRLVRELVRFGCLEQDARELAQEALIATWKHLDTIEAGAEWAYVKTAAHRLAINRNRDENTLRRGGGASISLDAIGGVTIDDTASAEERLIRVEQKVRFQRDFHTALEELSPDTRLCLILRRRGHTPREIAKDLGINGTAVRSRLARATRHLRERVGAPPKGLSWAELAGENDDDHEE